VETIGLYLTHLAEDGRRVATIERAFVAVSRAHTDAGYESPRKSPELQALRRGVRRQLGVASRQKAPLLPAEVRSAVKGAKAARGKPALALLRDRALLLLGFAGGFRRSELVELDIEDLAFTDDGLRVLIRQSKTDQEGEGRSLGIPPGGHAETCPVRAVKAYLEALEGLQVASGALFRPLTRTGKLRRTRLTPQSVALVVKQAALQAGVNPKDYAGHSLRAGLVTAAARAGKSIPSIMRQTGHRSVATVTKYVREVELFAENAAEGVGL
jgi:integrase